MTFLSNSCFGQNVKEQVLTQSSTDANTPVSKGEVKSGVWSKLSLKRNPQSRIGKGSVKGQSFRQPLSGLFGLFSKNTKAVDPNPNDETPSLADNVTETDDTESTASFDGDVDIESSKDPFYKVESFRNHTKVTINLAKIRIASDDTVEKQLNSLKKNCLYLKKFFSRTDIRELVETRSKEGAPSLSLAVSTEKYKPRDTPLNPESRKAKKQARSKSLKEDWGKNYLRLRYIRNSTLKKKAGIFERIDPEVFKLKSIVEDTEDTEDTIEGNVKETLKTLKIITIKLEYAKFGTKKADNLIEKLNTLILRATHELEHLKDLEPSTERTQLQGRLEGGIQKGKVLAARIEI